jgi:hypothetical protein
MNIIKVSQTWFMLKLTYTLVPIIIGLDKFTNMVTDWPKYVSPIVMEYLPLTMAQLLMAVGIIEIVAGVIVWFYPRLGGYIIVAWLGVIILNLASMNMYYDIIARDVVIAIGALALAWLSEAKKA